MELLLITVGLNCLSFLLMAFDKNRAIRHKRRISEFTFFVLSALGGWFGILLAMRFIHHKNKKPSFLYKILAGLLVSLLGVYALIPYL